MSKQVLKDFLQRTVDASKNKAENSQKGAFINELGTIVSEWENTVKTIKAVKVDSSTSEQSTWGQLAKEATSLVKLQTALSSKKLKLTKAQEILISNAIKSALPSDIDRVISEELDAGFKKESGSFNVKISTLPPLSLLDLTKLTSTVKGWADRSKIPDILANKYDYGIKMCLKSRLEVILVDSISSCIKQQNEMLINRISQASKISQPNVELSESLNNSTKTLSSNIRNTEESVKSIVSNKYSISEKDIRESYKAFIHIFDLGLFFEKLEKDLKDLEVTISNPSSDKSLNTIKNIFGEVASTARPDFHDSDWNNGTGFGIWIPFKYNKDQANTLKSILISSYSRSTRDLVLSNINSDVLDKLLNSSDVSTREVKASSRKPMEETTKLATNIGKRIASEAYLIYKELLKEEKDSVLSINPSIQKTQLGKVSVPLNKVPLICKLVAYTANSTSVDVNDEDSIRRFFLSSGTSHTFVKDFGTKIFQSGHINPVIGWSSWMYGFRHYLHNSLSRAGDTDLATFYNKEAKYFEAIARALEESRKSNTLKNSVLALSGAGSIKNSLSILLLDRLHNEVVSSNITFFRSMSQGKNLQASINIFLERRNVSEVKPAEFQDLMYSVAAANFGMGVVTHPELARANMTFGTKISRLHIKYQDLLLNAIIKDLDKLLNSEDKVANLKGSKSISQLIQAAVEELLRVGKAQNISITSSATHNTKKKVSNTGLTNTLKVKTSITSKVVSKAKPVLNIKAKLSTQKNIRPKNPTKVPANPVTVTNNKPKDIGPLLSQKPRLRDLSGKFTSITNIKNILDQRLSDVVKSKMGRNGSLVNRTGRFAESATVLDASQAGDSIDVRYTYMKKPYQTFEPGFQQGSAQRDPRKIIGESIREIVSALVKQRLRITRV